MPNVAAIQSLQSEGLARLLLPIRKRSDRVNMSRRTEEHPQQLSVDVRSPVEHRQEKHSQDGDVLNLVLLT